VSVLPITRSTTNNNSNIDSVVPQPYCSLAVLEAPALSRRECVCTMWRSMYLELGSAEQQQSSHHRQRRKPFFSRTTEVIDMSCSGALLGFWGLPDATRDTLWILTYIKCFGDFDLAARKKGMGWECAFSFTMCTTERIFQERYVLFLCFRGALKD
jgi:hypothetical protein